jgi:hypothetical protein
MSVLTTLISVIVGFALKSAYDYFIHSQDRRDKYFFALLIKRFEVYQAANSICEQLKSVVHDKTNAKVKITNEARTWFYNNNLYLSPDLRKDFRCLIMDVEFYGTQLDDYFFTSQQQGNDNKVSKKKYDELMTTWKRIMSGTQEKLQSDLEQYFKAMV